MRTPNGSSGYCQVADWVLLWWTKSRGRCEAVLCCSKDDDYCGTLPFFIECLKWDTILKRVTIFPSGANATKVKAAALIPYLCGGLSLASFQKREKEARKWGKFKHTNGTNGGFASSTSFLSHIAHSIFEVEHEIVKLSQTVLRVGRNRRRSNRWTFWLLSVFVDAEPSCPDDQDHA